MTQQKAILTKNPFKHSIHQHRDKVNQLQPDVSEPIHYQQHIPIKISVDFSLVISIYRPEHIEPPYPTIFYIPGTAFVADEFVFTELICSHIAKQSRCQVIVLRHRLAPEYPFPAGLNDIYHLLHGIVQHENYFNIDKHHMVIMGYSSGGNFAATMTCYLPSTIPPFQRQILICPILDLSRKLTAYKNDFENQDHIIKDNFVDWFVRLYLPENVSPQHPLVSPSWNSIEQVKNSPPTDIVFGEIDRFRSDAEHYYLTLVQAQVTAFRLMITQADHSFLWFKLTVAQAIGARVKVALGLAPVPRPLFDNYAAFFIKIQRYQENKRRHQIAENCGALIPYKKL